MTHDEAQRIPFSGPEFPHGLPTRLNELESHSINR
jgi:hypothetical protein